MKNLGVLLFIISLASCGFKVTESEIVWRSTDSNISFEKASKEANQLDWKVESVSEFGGARIEQKAQTLAGREVLQTYSKTALDVKTAQPFLFSAQYKLKGFLPVIPDTTDPVSLKEKFLEKYPEYSKFKTQDPEAVLIQDGSAFLPLWKLIYEDHHEARQILFSKDLKIHSKKVISSHFDVHATIFPKGPKRSELTQVLLSELSEFTKLSSSRVLVDSEAPESALNTQEPLVYNPKDPQFDQVQAYYILDSSLRWFEQKFGYKPFKKIQAVVHLSFPEKTNAAFYYSGKIRIGTGDDVQYSRLAQDPSIVIHESAHSVIEAVARLPFEGEGGSLNEGFADFFASVQLQNPFMGEVAFLKGPYKRSLLTVVKFNEKDGGLYHDSHILSGLLWEIYQTLGETKSLKVASRLLVEMHSQSNFAELRTLLPKVLTDVLEPADLRKATKIAAERGF